MIMKTKLMILGLLVFGFAITINAQTTNPKVRKEQIKQEKRIAQGVESGALTRKETAKLKKQQASVNFTKKEAKADGVVSEKNEQKYTQKKLNLANKFV